MQRSEAAAPFAQPPTRTTTAAPPSDPPRARRRPTQVLNEDKWIKEASDSAIDGARKQLKKYNASRKLRKAALGIIAQQRVERALASLREDAAKKAATKTAAA